MWRLVGILVAVVGLYIAQSIHDFYLARDYTELEATLTAYDEDCYFKKDLGHGPYFNCGSAAKMTDASGTSDSKIERRAKLTYRYRFPSDSAFREARTESWAVETGKFWVGQKRNISVKNDEHDKVLWSRLVGMQ
jgi:hypothetical protein